MEQVVAKTEVDNELPSKPLHLYLIGTRLANFLKLGLTENIGFRLTMLQTGCPFPLHVIWVKRLEPEAPFEGAPRHYYTPRKFAIGMEALMAREGMRLGYWKHAHREWFSYTKPLRRHRSVDSEIKNQMEELYEHIIKKGKDHRAYSAWFQFDSRRIFARDA